MATSGRISGKTVLIIGGGSGIGAAVAGQAMARGAKVVLAGRRLDRAGALAASLGADARAERVDLLDAASIRALYVRLAAFDHLVLTAGPAIGSPTLGETDIEMARQAFDVKFWGALQAAQLALPHLARNGSITFTSGLLARKAVSGTLIKSTINAAIEAMTKTLAKELAPLRVNAVSPGVTDTAAYAHMDGAARGAMLAKVGAALPVGRAGRPDDIAQGYLLAMENGFMSGAVIDIEGGGLL